VVIDIKQQKSQFKNSNFTITQSAKFFFRYVVTALKIILYDIIICFCLQTSEKYATLNIVKIVSKNDFLHMYYSDFSDFRKFTFHMVAQQHS